MKQQLVSVSLFYKNNTQQGFGLTLAASVYHALNAETNAVWEGFRGECNTDDCIAAILLEQLYEFGKCKTTLSDQQRLMVAMNIVMLAERGYIGQTEFDGIQYCYVDENAAKTVTDALFR